MKNNFLKITTITILLLIIVTGCKKEVDVTGISLDKNDITLSIGKTETLTATVHPHNAANKAISWASSNPSVATVINGVVIANEEGTAIIIVATEEGNYTAMCEVTVTSKDVSVTGVMLNKTNLTLIVGTMGTLTTTVVPHDATNKAVNWTSSNATVATVANGIITAKEEGTAIITVTTDDGNYTATCAVIVTPEWVEIDGIKWATRNVDKPGNFVANPEDAGMFYQWNRKIGWSSTGYLINSNGGTTWDSSVATGDSWEKSNDPCPTGWRVPTMVELSSLINAHSEWSILNGVNGRYFGAEDIRVFLPAAGFRDHEIGMLNSVGNAGYCWSSTAFTFTGEYNYAYGINFDSELVSWFNGGYRSQAFSIRCVLE